MPDPIDPGAVHPDAVRDVLTTTRRIAVVGASDKPGRPVHGVMAFLIARGFDVVGVNPGLAGRTVLGRPVVASLDEAGPLDLVDVFRASDQVAGVMDDAIRLGARTVWLQLGVHDPVAAQRGREAGLIVVEDRCPMIEWRRLGLPMAPALEPELITGHVVDRNKPTG